MATRLSAGKAAILRFLAFRQEPWRRRERRRRLESARRFKELFGECLSCGGAVGGHWYWRLASELIEASTDREGKLAGLVSSSQWDAASRVKEWQGDHDVRELYAIKCPRGIRLGLYTVVSTVDLYSDDYREDAALLSVRDSESVARLAGGQWHSFDMAAEGPDQSSQSPSPDGES
jgi:hypothetical protein